METIITTKQELIFMKGTRALTAHPSEIIRMEAFSNYTYVYFTHHPRVLMAKVLHAYDELLRPRGFVRAHKSHLINPVFVKEVSRKGTILLSDNTIIEIARRRKREVFTQCFRKDIENKIIFM